MKSNTSISPKSYFLVLVLCIAACDQKLAESSPDPDKGTAEQKSPQLEFSDAATVSQVERPTSQPVKPITTKPLSLHTNETEEESTRRTWQEKLAAKDKYPARVRLISTTERLDINRTRIRQSIDPTSFSHSLSLSRKIENLNQAFTQVFYTRNFHLYPNEAIEDDTYYYFNMPPDPNFSKGLAVKKEDGSVGGWSLVDRLSKQEEE